MDSDYWEPVPTRSNQRRLSGRGGSRDNRGGKRYFAFSEKLRDVKDDSDAPSMEELKEKIQWEAPAQGKGPDAKLGGFGGGICHKPTSGGHIVKPTKVPVQTEMIKRIIGRGGSKIRELESLSGATIQVVSVTKIGEEISDGLTEVILTGNVDDQNKAVCLIKQFLSSLGKRTVANDGSSLRGSGTNVGEEYRTMCVPTDQVRHIIGVKGSKIKEISTTSRAEINISRSDGPEQTVTLLGSPRAVDEAEWMIDEILQQFL